MPSRSAASTIASAMRSFTEPPGFWPSSLTRRRTAGFGLSSVTSTIGVLPIRSSTDRATATPLPAGDGGQDRHDVAVGDLRIELVEVPDVLVVQVDVDELPDRSVVVGQLS